MNNHETSVEPPYREFQKKGAFLSLFTEEDWEMFTQFTVTEHCDPGMEVAHYLERDRTLYIVTQGEFEVFIPMENAPKKIITLISAGSVFGELGFFDGEPRLASIIATKPSQVLKLNHQNFEKMRTEAPFLAQQLLLELGRLLTSRFRILSRMIHK